MNPALRLMLNYVYSRLDREGVTGNTNSIQTRLQLDF